jgi:WD40 repeat protein
MRRRAVLAGLLWLAGGRAPRAAPAAPVTALAFSPDGSLLVSSGYREILLRPAREPAVGRRISCDLSQVHDLAFSPNGRLLAAAGGTPGTSGAVHLLAWPGGKRVAALGGLRDLAASVEFSPDGKRLAVASSDRSVQVWNVGAALAGTVPRSAVSLVGHAGAVPAVAWSPDAKLLVTAGVDRSLRVWDARSGEMLRALTNHTGPVHCVAFRPPGPANGNPHPYCASGSEDRTVRVWQPGIGRMVRIVRGHAGPVLAVLYSRDGTCLFSAGTEGVVRVIDAESDRVLRSWKAHDQWIYSLALSPDGKILATGDWSGRVRVWDWHAAHRPSRSQQPRHGRLSPSDRGGRQSGK